MLGIHLTDGVYRYEVVLNAFSCKTESPLLPGIASTVLHAYCKVSINANVGNYLCLSDDLFLEWVYLTIRLDCFCLYAWECLSKNIVICNGEKSCSATPSLCITVFQTFFFFLLFLYPECKTKLLNSDLQKNYIFCLFPFAQRVRPF